jgi:hypothetical protein
MLQPKSPTEQIREIQTQLDLLKQQASLLTSQNTLLAQQMALQVLQQTAQAGMEKGTADKLKELADSRAALEKARAAAPFAELQGIRAALATVAVPGKEGTITLSRGTEGALLVRVKSEMLKTLDEAARKVVAALPSGGDEFIMATNADLEAAYRSEIIRKRIAQQKSSLDSAYATVRGYMQGKPHGGLLAPQSLAGALAAAQTIPFVLNALSDAAKFFRVDRSYSIFDANDEAKRLLELFVERHGNPEGGNRRVSRVDDLSDKVIGQAQEFLGELNALKKLHDEAAEISARVQKESDDSTGTPDRLPPPDLPDAFVLASLKGVLASTKAILDTYNPGTNPENFWSQVSGRLKYMNVPDKGRIHLTVTAQTVQVLEKRVWRSDRLLGSGETMVEYRITGKDGNYITSGVSLFTSSTRDVFQEDASQEFVFPQASGAAH